MTRRSPLGAFLGGLAAGFVGALAQNLFFAATKRLAPPAPDPYAFDPAEPDQYEELPTQTVARRVIENVMQRGPLVKKDRAGQIVHFAFGSSWGGLYGLAAGSLPRGAALGKGLAFGFGVWLASDDVLLPAFRLSAWPQHYRVDTHLYAIAAHAAYGSAVAFTFAAIDRLIAPATAGLGSLWLTRRLPRLFRPSARQLVNRGLRFALPMRAAMAELRA
jgi:hypothetical protein